MIPDSLWPDPDGLERTVGDPAERARAVAKARGERYDPAKHGPFEDGQPPSFDDSDRDGKLAALIDRFANRPVRWGPRLVRDRPDIDRWVHR